MSIKSILVPFNAADASSAALKVALMMGRKYDAHVTGLFCADPTRALRSGMRAYRDLVKAVQEGHQYLKTQATELFKQQTAEEARARSGKIHWITVDRDADRAVMEYARYVDMTVLAEVPSGTVREETEFHADRIALTSGRPVLVVPEGYETNQLGEHAVIAWDARRAAARALGDAMQILETKSRVTVLTVGEKHPHAEEGLDIAEHLRRHGLNPEMVAVPRRNRSVADVIVSYCEEQGAGILIMGAYEHSKFSEDLFGGVTNSVLRKSRIPTLMAH